MTMASSQDTTQDNKKARPSHEFSSPWKDSDLVLVVENQNLHVHRIILKMVSPVFETMLSGDFKEKNQQEIPLPGKNADEFVDFLRQIYPQFDYPITLENIEHIYTLADEYETEAVTSSCLKELLNITLTRDNLSQVLVLAQKMDSDEVRQKCYKYFNDLTVDEITSFIDFESLDCQSLIGTLLRKAESLEYLLKRIQPQFFGLLDCLSYVWMSKVNNCNMGGKPTPCEDHMRPFVIAPITERLKCSACVRAWKEMAYHSKEVGPFNEYFYSGDMCMHFDEDVVTILQELDSIFPL